MPKGIYDRNAPVKTLSILLLEEFRGQVRFSIGEVMQFFVADNIMTVPESCEKCSGVNSFSWNNERTMRVIH